MRASGWFAALRADWQERITQDSLLVLGGQLAVQALGLVSSALLARGLAPAGFSFYAITGVIIGIGGAVADFGLSQSAVRLIAGLRSDAVREARETAVAFARLKLLGALLVSAIVALAAAPLAALLELPASDGPGWVRLAALGIFAAALAGSVSPVHQARRRFGPQMATQLVNSAVTVLLVAVAFVAGALTINVALWIGAITAVAGALAGYRLLPIAWRAVWSWRVPLATGGRRLAGRLLRFSRWLWLAAILAILVAQLDLLLINLYLPPATVGLYALALNLSHKAGLLNQSLFTVLLPTVSSLEHRSQFSDYVKRSLVRSLLPAVAVLLALPFMPTFIRLVYGADYAGAAPIFLAFAVVILFDLFWTPLGLLAFPLDLPGVIAAGQLIRVLVLAGAALLLIPLWGVYGAIAAKLLAKLAGAALSGWLIYLRWPAAPA